MSASGEMVRRPVCLSSDGAIEFATYSTYLDAPMKFRFRYSLRTAFIVMTAIALFFAWLGATLRKYRKIDAAVAQLAAKNVIVSFTDYWTSPVKVGARL
jgi:hypothetical protein